VGNNLFFTKSNERDDFFNGFAWQDIYVAPWGRLQDSVKIALRTEIKAITPDSKYILAQQDDLPNGVRVIIDVQTKKYQLLLGREYEKYPAFYSYEKEKFAFDFGDYIIYVDFPKEYPFDALKLNRQLFGDGFDIKKQLQHKAVEESYKLQIKNVK
jgi:hypothetical protein